MCWSRPPALKVHNGAPVSDPTGGGVDRGLGVRLGQGGCGVLGVGLWGRGVTGWRRGRKMLIFFKYLKHIFKSRIIFPKQKV